MTQFKTAFAILCLVSVPATALAEQSATREALKRYCTGDYMEHCSEHSPGTPELEACFRANLRNLTPGCASAITTYQREQKATRRVSEAR